MKRCFRILVLVLTMILFMSSALWVFGICTNSSIPFTFILGYTSTIILGVGLFVLGLFGICKLGDWAFKKD